MGLIARSFETLGELLPGERKAAVEQAHAIAAAVPSWQQGQVAYGSSPLSYQQHAMSGYLANEIVFACFPEGTDLTLSDGRVVPIESAVVGEQVTGHSGQSRTITEVMERRYAGDLVRIKRVGRTGPIVCTAAHPFLVARKPSNPRHWFGYSGRGSWRKLGRQLDRLKYGWLRADEVRDGDYLVEAVPTETEDQETYSLQRTRRAGRRSGPRGTHTDVTVAVTPELLRLIGYFLAEGWVNAGSVHFAFHRKETEYHEDVDYLMVKFFDAHDHRYMGLENGQTRVLTFNSVKAGAFFAQFGRGARNKAIPAWIMRLPVDKQRELLRGFWRGDGCQTRAGLNFSTASRSLAEQTHVLLLRQGLVSGMVTVANRSTLPKGAGGYLRTQYDVQVNGAAGRVCAELMGVDRRSDAWPGTRNAAFLHNGLAHYTVRSIATEQVDGLPVFNLEVDEDHSYVACGVQAHNCVEELSTSAAEPRLAAYRNGETTAEMTSFPKPIRVLVNPVLDLFERPNPFLDRFQFWAGVIMHLSVAGNAYIEKVRSASGQVVELWLLRPDRMHVIPDAQKFIKGYVYRVGDQQFPLLPSDVIHLKNRHPLDDYYGLAPIAVAMPRLATDNAMRAFAQAFFANGATPAGLLNIKRAVSEAEREQIKNRMRQQYGGPAGWHSTLVIDGSEASYTATNMALGDTGLAMPALDEVNEARIGMVFGVPLTLIGARAGQHSSSYANRVSDRQEFWNETLIPLYRRLAAGVSNSLADDFDGWDYLEFDMADVHALSEDEDAKHTRVRSDMTGGVITREEARQELGYEPEPEDGTWVLPMSTTTTKVADEFAEPEPAPLPAAGFGQALPAGDGQTDGGGQPALAGDHANGTAGAKVG